MKNHQSTIYIRAIATQKIYLKSNNPGAIVEKSSIYHLHQSDRYTENLSKI
ncbi:MAG: hypothetical protein F6K23_10065 [Okeania sp. SIO2C9]|uniref:hypothetical protein n=1 Tax=unclassified Okeania TaxID=2634635 RepID=UPI0013C03BEC|nr:MULTISPECIES: hypothetical protein [unclassified Okeania]NEQ73386.1 hypothetical protein [Okeania sp. SIO2C9]NET29602.1 hypothetical protein [Okeania sp. SIO1I7]